MAKRLKNRSMSMYRGPLSKMIDDAVNDRMAALKKTTEGEEEDMIFDMRDVEGKTRHVEFDSDDTKLSDDWYAQNTSFGSEEEFKRELGQEQVDIAENREASNRFYNDADKVDFENMSDIQQKTLSSLYGKQVDNLDVYQKDGKFYIDQGTHMGNEKGFTNPIEITDPAFQTPDQASAQAAEQEAPQGGNPVTVAQIFNVNPETVTTNSEDRTLLNQFSESNPSFDWMQDEKKVQKARKLYEKYKKNATDSRGKNISFFEYSMKHLPQKVHGGEKGSLNVSAKSWETKNKPGRDGGSGEGLQGGSKSSVTASYVKDKGSWRDGVREASEAPDPAPTNKLKYANPNHVLNKRTMSFRRKR